LRKAGHQAGKTAIELPGEKWKKDDCRRIDSSRMSADKNPAMGNKKEKFVQNIKHLCKYHDFPLSCGLASF
jgi:hypothetical protein